MAVVVKAMAGMGIAVCEKRFLLTLESALDSHLTRAWHLF
jgi:hypothetical protein